MESVRTVLPKSREQYLEVINNLKEVYELSPTEELLALLVEAIVDLKEVVEIPYETM